MSTLFLRQEAPPTPPEANKETYVSVHALEAGHLTLPERFFVHPASETARKTVPSLAFLIQHQDLEINKTTRILLDLGLRRNIQRYAEPIQKHINTRQPLTTDPDVIKSLAAGGLTPDDIDYVVYTHVHWDHVGEPLDFPKSTFIVGYGALDVLKGSSSSLRGSHSFFESDLLPPTRTIELLNPYEPGSPLSSHTTTPPTADTLDFNQPFLPHGTLPRTLDIFHDQSLLIVDAPGHLPGHINLLARTGPDASIYLAGDACHDRRIIRGEREIGSWLDGEGQVCCIHADRPRAEETIARIKGLEEDGLEGRRVEVVFSHDWEWEEKESNKRRFFGA